MWHWDTPKKNTPLSLYFFSSVMMKYFISFCSLGQRKYMDMFLTYMVSIISKMWTVIVVIWYKICSDIICASAYKSILHTGTLLFSSNSYLGSNFIIKKVVSVDYSSIPLHNLYMICGLDIAGIKPKFPFHGVNFLLEMPLLETR